MFMPEIDDDLDLLSSSTTAESLVAASDARGRFSAVACHLHSGKGLKCRVWSARASLGLLRSGMWDVWGGIMVCLCLCLWHVQASIIYTQHKLWYGLWHVLFRVLCAVIHPHSYCMKGGRKGGEVGQERESEERGGKKEGGSL
jgi:hypothetical protein